VKCAVQFQPRNMVEITKVTAKLVGEESVESGGGENSKTFTHTIHSEEIMLGSVRRIAAMEMVKLEGALRIPDHVPCTFIASSNELNWEITLRISIAGWPDWTSDYPITVSP